MEPFYPESTIQIFSLTTKLCAKKAECYEESITFFAKRASKFFKLSSAIGYVKPKVPSLKFVKDVCQFVPTPL